MKEATTIALLSKRIFESRHEPIAPSHTFLWRVILMSGLAILLTSAFLAVGMFGYHYWGEMPWIESFLNAAMILSGMGEIDILKTSSAKIFAGVYAIFSGLYFAVVIAVLFAPFVHSFYHKFHLSDETTT